MIRNIANKWTGNDLDRKVTIYTIASVTVDSDTNYETPVYDAGVTVPAMVSELPASKEVEISGGIVYDSVLQVVIRYKEAYESTDIKLTYKGKEYDIVSTREGHERRRWLVLKCVYGGKQLNK